MIVELLISLLVLIGAAFALIGSIGLAALPDFYLRLHGPTKATTLGVGAVLIASSLAFSAGDAGMSLHELLVTLFLFITAPVSAHLMARAALTLRVPARGASADFDRGAEVPPPDQPASDDASDRPGERP